MSEEEIEDTKSNLKDTFSSFFKEDEIELPQIDAIKAYNDKTKQTIPSKRKKLTTENDDDDENEDDEHMKRVKKALLESLEKVKEMEYEIFNKKDKETFKKIKIKTEKQNINQQENDKVQTLKKEDQEISRE